MSFSVSSRKRRITTKNSKFKVMGEHKAFLSRIKKSLYYGKMPLTERFSLPITELAAELYSEVKAGHSLDRLDIEDAAVMTRNACVSPCSLVLALLYLERLKACNPDYLQRIPSSELFLVSLMVASKFLHDEGEDNEVLNDEWAASAGIDVAGINRYEKDFLHAIEWEIFVGEEAFWKRLNSIERDVALREGKRRGWFSYTDLDNILDAAALGSIAQVFIAISAICLTSYAASVLTLIGSAFIVSHVPGTSMNSRQPSTPLPAHTPADTSSQSPLDRLSSDFILSSLNSFSNDSATQVLDSPISLGTEYLSWISVLLDPSWTSSQSLDRLSSDFILSSLNSYSNDSSTQALDSPISLGTEYPSWISILFNPSWTLWNHNLESLYSYYSEGAEATRPNRSWEKEDAWKEMRHWLLVTDHHQHSTRFLPLTSNY